MAPQRGQLVVLAVVSREAECRRPVAHLDGSLRSACDAHDRDRDGKNDGRKTPALLIVTVRVRLAHRALPLSTALYHTRFSCPSPCVPLTRISGDSSHRPWVQSADPLPAAS